MQQTPYVDYSEGIYRYRFQGTTFAEREGFLSSSDVGASFHYNFRRTTATSTAAFYNGENYNKPEVNNQKAWHVPRQLPAAATADSVLRGLRFTGFINDDCLREERRSRRGDLRRDLRAPLLQRVVRVPGHEGPDLGDARPRPTAKGWSVWVNPKTPQGLGRALRVRPPGPQQDRRPGAERTIVGVSYWFPHQGTVSTALLLDYDDAKFKNFTPAQPEQKKIAHPRAREFLRRLTTHHI